MILTWIIIFISDYCMEFFLSIYISHKYIF